MKTLRTLFVTTFLILWVTTTHAQTIGDKVYFSPQRMLEVESGRFLNIYCSGQGSPVVILEAGLGASTAWWGFVQPEISKRTTTCSYDRAGIGFSGASPYPSSVKFLVTDLEKLLMMSGLNPPYIFVGHSYGGMIVRHFVDRYPEKSAGMVLVDSSHENQATAMYAVSSAKRKYQSSYIEDLRRCAEGASEGYVPNTELHKLCVYGAFNYYSDDLNASMQKWLNSPDYKHALLSENENVFFNSADQLFASRMIHENFPLIVLSRDENPKASWETVDERKKINAVWDRLQEDHARISSVGEVRIVKDSGHLVPMENPQAIIDAVIEILNQL